MLESFSKHGFSGRSANGMSYDWMEWKGGAHGYEGFLQDNYYTFLAVLDGEVRMAAMP